MTLSLRNDDATRAPIRIVLDLTIRPLSFFQHPLRQSLLLLPNLLRQLYI